MHDAFDIFNVQRSFNLYILSKFDTDLIMPSELDCLYPRAPRLADSNCRLMRSTDQGFYAASPSHGQPKRKESINDLDRT